MDLLVQAIGVDNLRQTRSFFGVVDSLGGRNLVSNTNSLSAQLVMNGRSTCLLTVAVHQMCQS
jgi:hypothetical protein